MIRHCGMAKRGRRALRVSVYINPPNKILRAFANLKQGITRRQLICIRKAIIGKTIGINWAKPGFMEWSMRFTPDGETARVAGPGQLREWLKRKK